MKYFGASALDGSKPVTKNHSKLTSVKHTNNTFAIHHNFFSYLKLEREKNINHLHYLNQLLGYDRFIQ